MTDINICIGEFGEVAPRYGDARITVVVRVDFLQTNATTIGDFHSGFLKTAYLYGFKGNII